MNASAQNKLSFSSRTLSVCRRNDKNIFWNDAQISTTCIIICIVPPFPLFHFFFNEIFTERKFSSVTHETTSSKARERKKKTAFVIQADWITLTNSVNTSLEFKSRKRHIRKLEALQRIWQQHLFYCSNRRKQCFTGARRSFQTNLAFFICLSLVPVFFYLSFIVLVVLSCCNQPHSLLFTWDLNQLRQSETSERVLLLESSL